MKIRRLIEVDLARLAPLPADEQRRRMAKMVGGGGRFSFKPMRDLYPDIMNVQPPIFASLGPSAATDFAIIEAKLLKSCRSIEELASNMQASRMLHSHYRTTGTVSIPYSFGHMALGLERGIQYWDQSFYARDGHPVITFIDPRGGQGLTSIARDVVFSAMHAAVRERNPDFSEAVLEIIQLPYDRKVAAKAIPGRRTLQVHTLTGDPKYTFAEIDKMLTDTLRNWDEVCAAAAADTRKRAGGKGTLI
jgi:hypothetical protein